MKLLFAKNKGMLVETINVLNQPAGKRGIVQFTDLDGKLYVRWTDGSKGVIRERGDVYRIVDISKKNVWKIKRLYLILLLKLKHTKLWLQNLLKSGSTQ
jgi:hypothetical protein